MKTLHTITNLLNKEIQNPFVEVILIKKKDSYRAWLLNEYNDEKIDFTKTKSNKNVVKVIEEIAKKISMVNTPSAMINGKKIFIRDSIAMVITCKKALAQIKNDLENNCINHMVALNNVEYDWQIEK